MIAAELLSEPVSVPDTYASGVSHIEDLGDGNFRITLYARQASIYGGEEYVIVARLVLPFSALHDGARQTMKALGLACCGAGRMASRH